jgi:hypothetical protein
MIPRVNENFRSGSVTMVIASNGENNWIERSEKLEIETALLQENERRSNQASDTPFLAPPLYNLIGPLGIGPHADAVLGGTLVAAPPMPLDLPQNEYLRGWRSETDLSRSVLLTLHREHHGNKTRLIPSHTGPHSVFFGLFGSPLATTRD